MEPVIPRLMPWFTALEARYAGVRFETLVIGDSRAALWPAEQVARIGPGQANLGVGAERVEHILWRAIHSRLDYAGVRRVVVAAGTNNITKNKNTPAQTAAGVRQIVEVLRARAPLAAFRTHDMYEAAAPATGKYADANRRELNRRLALQAGQSGLFEHVPLAPMDVGDAAIYVHKPGRPTLHLTPEGYLPVTAAVAASFGGERGGCVSAGDGEVEGGVSGRQRAAGVGIGGHVEAGSAGDPCRVKA